MRMLMNPIQTIRRNRGTLTEPGKECDYRDRPPEEA